jgi:hypothetical protein
MSHPILPGRDFSTPIQEVFDVASHLPKIESNSRSAAREIRRAFRINRTQRSSRRTSPCGGRGISHQSSDDEPSQEMPALHSRGYSGDVDKDEASHARNGKLMVSIFRPFGNDGSEPVRCSYPECNVLNPPEAKICWTCKRPLIRAENEGAGVGRSIPF